ncbi:MAG: hypothetical protein P8R37_04920 [Opitutae bacterium]|nr:hypothetical protein [Opitutae bacterium]MDG1300910.1 hypothetical protein [Opitutae bacterium]
MSLSPPTTAAEVTFNIDQVSDFQPRFKQWQSELKQISSARELHLRIQDAPPLLRSRLKDHGYCDAYLAAYVDWICQLSKTTAPSWVTQSNRIADSACIDDGIDLSQTPQPFRQRNLFTIPENVVHLRRGRPKKSAAHKLKNNAARQQRHRQRVKAKLARLEQLERELEK